MKERMQYEDFFPSKIRSTPEPLGQVQPNCHRAPQGAHRGYNCKIKSTPLTTFKETQIHWGFFPTNLETKYPWVKGGIPVYWG